MFFANWIKNICFSYGIVGSFFVKIIICTNEKNII